VWATQGGAGTSPSATDTGVSVEIQCHRHDLLRQRAPAHKHRDAHSSKGAPVAERRAARAGPRRVCCAKAVRCYGRIHDGYAVHPANRFVECSSSCDRNRTPPRETNENKLAPLRSTLIGSGLHRKSTIGNGLPIKRPRSKIRWRFPHRIRPMRVVPKGDDVTVKCQSKLDDCGSNEQAADPASVNCYCCPSRREP